MLLRDAHCSLCRPPCLKLRQASNQQGALEASKVKGRHHLVAAHVIQQQQAAFATQPVAQVHFHILQLAAVTIDLHSVEEELLLCGHDDAHVGVGGLRAKIGVIDAIWKGVVWGL